MSMVNRGTNNEVGSALIIVLVIVMAVTVLSLGFLSRSDVELACGSNMELRFQADYTAESALEYAKIRIFNPQDVNSEYWTGMVEERLEADEDEYFDVSVTKLGNLNYYITCEGYRKKDANKIGSSSLEAELRLDPCIAFWSGGNTTISSGTVIHGDVYCGSALTIQGSVNGDAYASASINGIALGQEKENILEAPVGWPVVSSSDFSSSYYYDGGGPYSAKGLSSGSHNTGQPFPDPGMNNPGCVYYRDGDLDLADTIVINGTLVVNGDLRLGVNADITIIPVKNFPALIVSNDIHFNEINTRLSVTGLVQVDHHIDMNNKLGSVLEVYGGLYIGAGGIKNAANCSVTITMAPNKAAIEKWSDNNNKEQWSPIGGAFFKTIKRTE